jgi:hypothetical protein
MSYTMRSVYLPDRALLLDGCAPPEALRCFSEAREVALAIEADARAQADQTLSMARRDADACLQAARAECDRLRDTSHAQAAGLVAEVQQQWLGCIGQIEAAAVAIAREALRDFGAELSESERLVAAVRMALAQLPGEPVSLSLPRGCSWAPALPELGSAKVSNADLDVGDIELGTDSLTVAVNVDEGWAQVVNGLGLWLALLAPAHAVSGEPSVVG